MAGIDVVALVFGCIISLVLGYLGRKWWQTALLTPVIMLLHAVFTSSEPKLVVAFSWLLFMMIFPV